MTELNFGVTRRPKKKPHKDRIGHLHHGARLLQESFSVFLSYYFKFGNPVMFR